MQTQVPSGRLWLIKKNRKLHQYLNDQKFILECDFKPLLAIFGEKKGIPQIAASRLQRWAIYLSAFDYEIRYKKGVNNSNADCLSRLCTKKENDEKVCMKINVCRYVDEVENQCAMVDFKKIRFETNRDVVLSKVIDFVNRGFPIYNIEESVKAYMLKANELSIEKGILMWGRRVVIPLKLRKKLLEELHSSHLGIVKTKSIARSYFWWPKIDQEIENEIQNCRACRLCQPSPSKNILIPWNVCNRPWERIHVDFLGPVENKMYFIILDAFSKWVEVFPMSSMTSANTIICLRQVFARFGLPDTLVSDNGPQLVSEEFAVFLKQNGIIHKKSTPGHPATNGAAENAVRSFKTAMAKAIMNAKLNANTIDMNSFILKYLFDYRIAKHSATEETPAKLMLGREIKSRFDLIKPYGNEKQQIFNNDRKIDNFKGKMNKEFSVGENVVVRDYRDPNKEAWREAIVERRLGHRTYLCRTQDGTEWRRHNDQIANGINNNKIALKQKSDLNIPVSIDEQTEILSQSGDSCIVPIDASAADSNVPVSLRRSNRKNHYKGSYVYR